MKVTVKQYGECFKVIYQFTTGGGNPRDRPLVDPISCGGEFEKEECNIYRAKGRVRELALCNDWEYFVTLTLNSEKQDRYDISAYVKALGVWIGNYNKRFGCKLKYLLIPEQHKDGAWHMHGLFHDVSENSLIRNERGYLDMPYYVQRFGFISLAPIKSRKRVAAYITKYVAKGFGISEIGKNKHMFYASRGLLGSETIHEEEFIKTLPDGVWKNDYVGVEWFDTYEELARRLSSLERS